MGNALDGSFGLVMDCLQLLHTISNPGGRESDTNGIDVESNGTVNRVPVCRSSGCKVLKRSQDVFGETVCEMILKKKLDKKHKEPFN